jgi:hypothetical protein
MATATYEPIISYTLPSNASSVTLGSGGQGTIPTTGYTDLILVVNGGITSNREMLMRVNGDTGNNYSSTLLRGYGSSAGSQRESNSSSIFVGDYSSNPCTTIFQFNNYSNTNTNKTILTRISATGNMIGTSVALWRNTSAINSITLFSSFSLTAGTTFTLYGIANAQIEAPKATGGTITYDNTYFYHTFGASGTFTPTQNLTADYLIVAGGGGGGNEGGGGGAGGLRAATNVSLTSGTAYTATVGAGGPTTSGASTNRNGGNSTFNSVTSTGGGGSGQASNTNSEGRGANGGSGGGGAHNIFTAGTGNAGSFSPSEGNNGGVATNTTNNGGGGGGAIAVGQDGSGNLGGNGGAGSSTYSSWGVATGTGQNVSGVVHYAGGGGGWSRSSTAGVGGAGGGGNGGSAASGTAGLVNTGGGAGNSANGGSGVVIVRYLKA